MTDNTDPVRRNLVLGAGAAAAGLALSGGAAASQGLVQTETMPANFEAKQVPEPPPERSAGPVRPNRGSNLTDKLAVVTGAARGIGRAIAVEFASHRAEGARRFNTGCGAAICALCRW